MFHLTLPERLQAALLGALPAYGWGLRLAVGGLGAWLLSGLLWAFVLPASAPWTLTLERPQAVARELAGLSLQAGAPAPAGAGPSTHDLHLIGVLHSDRASGARVILRQDGALRPQVLAVGDEVAAGLRISRIEARQVTLSGAGREVVLALPQPAQAAPANETDPVAEK